jgi:A/G-specific adenine glycosylase
VQHVFTHFRLDLTVYRADVENAPAPPGHWWAPACELDREALPTVMLKAIELAVPGAGRPKRHGQ